MTPAHPHDWEPTGHELSANGKTVTLFFRCSAEAGCPAILRRMFVFADEEIDEEG